MTNVERLRAAGRRVAFIRDLPGLPAGLNDPECIETHSDQYDPCASPLPVADQMTTLAKTLRVPVIDPSRYVCDSSCHSVIGGVVVYFDTNHLTGTFASTLAPFVGAATERIVASGAR